MRLYLLTLQALHLSTPQTTAFHAHGPLHAASIAFDIACDFLNGIYPSGLQNNRGAQPLELRPLSELMSSICQTPTCRGLAYGRHPLR